MKESLKEPENSATSSLEKESFNIPRIIPEDVAMMAVNLTEYYQSQRMAYEQVLCECTRLKTTIVVN